MIYDVIKRMAEERNVSIYQIEKELKLSNGSISKWNVSDPTVSKLQKVATYLGVTTEEILRENNSASSKA